MLRVFCSIPKSLKRVLNSESQFCWLNNFFSINVTNKPSGLLSPAYPVNQISTCQWFLRDNIENIENFNPTKMIIKKDGTVKKKKKPVGVKVYLLNEKGISSSMLLQDAEKLAQSKRLMLKKMEDINNIASYKLVPISDVFKTELQTMKNGETKEEKIKKLIINEDINLHDLQVKINHINKFLDKGVKVFVKLGDKTSDSSKLNAVYGEIEKSLANHSISKFASKSGYHINITPEVKNTNKDRNK